MDAFADPPKPTAPPSPTHGHDDGLAVARGPPPPAACRTGHRGPVYSVTHKFVTCLSLWWSLLFFFHFLPCGRTGLNIVFSEFPVRSQLLLSEPKPRLHYVCMTRQLLKVRDNAINELTFRCVQNEQMDMNFFVVLCICWNSIQPPYWVGVSDR